MLTPKLNPTLAIAKHASDTAKKVRRDEQQGQSMGHSKKRPPQQQGDNNKIVQYED